MILLIVLLIPVYLYLGLTLDASPLMWIVLSILFIGIASIPLKKFFKSQLKVAYVSMGILNFLLTFTVLRDLLGFFSNTPLPSEHLYLFTALCFSAGALNASLGPKLKQIRINIEGLPKELEDLKIVQISDLHIGATTEKDYVEKMVRKINELEPDIICLTGDIGDGKAHHYREEIERLKNLRSTYGSYFVTGNHEYYWNAEEWIESMREAGITPILNDSLVLSHNSRKILLAGIPDPVSKLRPQLEKISKCDSDIDFKLLLSHRPEIAEEAAMAGFHLQLSGHTHGGQFFPWTFLLRFMHRFYKGLYKIHGMWMYVNCGSAAWGPPLRLGTSSEITLITLADHSRNS